jgi:hypothetical protein
MDWSYPVKCPGSIRGEECGVSWVESILVRMGNVHSSTVVKLLFSHLKLTEMAKLALC